ncbi:MAG TPA: tRNA (adenosine(37)-N6)-threonylcarbamoyltransferase complex dimerization subunit type 1 TsaB [Candidatus Eisenbacteria bacterium]|nr:tRNA (adenosine(37)-N6)-threonylcarbamoyltransferase complex dimerization subunit type 1 TsaB [Candidatus Eisenbacteria bacterium]
MLLLITDTSGKDGFVGLVRTGSGANPDRVELVEEIALAGGTFSAQLVPQISGLLEKHGFRKTDIGTFIVVSGPGSFTGLRVGLAAVKALAEILQKPIVPVSVLEVLAPFSLSIAASHDTPSVAMLRYAVALDASRGEAFVGEYEVRSEARRSPKAVGESLLSLDNLAALLESGVLQWISTPDQTIFDALGKKVSESKKHSVRRNVRRPRSEEVGILGLQKLKAGETVSPEQLEANYLRRTDAEIFSKPTSHS